MPLIQGTISLTSPAPTRLAVADLAQNRPNLFEVILTEPQRTKLAAELDLLGLRKVRFAGEIVAQGKRDWRLYSKLGATVVQPCVVTLDPVTTRIDTDVARIYEANFVYPDETEAEMPDDETREPLPEEIDLHEILAEALALNLPSYPRADGADLGEAVFTEPGKAAMRDEDARPFAGLAALREQLEDKEN